MAHEFVRAGGLSGGGTLPDLIRGDGDRKSERQPAQAVRKATSALTFFCRHCGSGATSQ